ncbi:hypothetical protein KY362_07885, partial [Candidatus Woesearchaeota archaeon]|nr:hypothetical protein [Candidatus Woesearchaeota archaeon]
MKPLTDKKYLAIVITIALLLRLLTILISNNNALIYDEVEYYQIATNLAQGQGYSTAEGPTAFRPPAYPVFLAAIQSING